MKVILFSIGTRGDIEPFLVIAQLLKERGCDVICVFPEQYRETVESMGLSFKGFNKAIVGLLNGNEMKMVFGNQGSFLKRVGILIRLAKVSLKLSKDSLALQHRIQMEENPDRILYHPKCNYSVLWGMENPGKSIMVNPTLDPLTDIGGSCGIRPKKTKNWFIFTMKAVMLKLVSKRYNKDLSGTKISVASIKQSMLKKEKTFYSISPSLVPRSTICHPNANIVGYFESNAATHWQPDVKLLQFIDKHEKIIFITFGSMTNPDPKEKTRNIIEVLNRYNIPAIINISGGGLEKIDVVSDNVFFTNSLPYNWIFPKIYAVVHHGGAGTTHTALKHACPCFVVAHVLDQFFWKKRISELHLGPQGLSIRKFNEKEFEINLLDLYYNKDYKRNACIMSKEMQSESDKNKLYELIISVEHFGVRHGE